MSEQYEAALFKVESIHHIHGDQCLCGFKSAVSRDRTKHIMEVTLEAAAPHLTAQSAGRAPDVRYATLVNGKTELDEVVAQNASVHLEVMDGNHWWMAITAGGKSVHVNLHTKRAKINATAEVEDD